WMHGWVHVNRAIQAADLVLNIGSRFDDRVTGKAATFAPKARIIHIDIDPAQIGKVVRADLGIVADAREAIRELLVRVRELLLADQPGPNGQRRREAWLHEIDALRLR